MYSLITLSVVICYLQHSNLSGESNSLTGLIVTLAIIALSGLPPRPLFFIKLDLFVRGVGQNLLAVSSVAILASLMILYMYINTVLQVILVSPSSKLLPQSTAVGQYYYILLVLLFASLFILMVN